VPSPCGPCGSILASVLRARVPSPCGPCGSILASVLRARTKTAAGYAAVIGELRDTR
jgi:bacterioferritin-associated ferredoxin